MGLVKMGIKQHQDLCESVLSLGFPQEASPFAAVKSRVLRGLDQRSDPGGHF